MSKQKIVGSFEAKTHFSEIMHQVHDNGIEYIVTNRGVPIARILPYENLQLNEVQEAIRKFRSYKKKYIMQNKDFDYLNAKHQNHNY